MPTNLDTVRRCNAFTDNILQGFRMFSTKEEIFESVGGEETKSEALATLRENAAFRLGEKDPDRGAVGQESLNPRTAFEVFAGKTYHQQSYSIADSNERRTESPMQRFARLRGELDDLVGDLDSLTKDQTDAGSEGKIWSVLQSEARQMVAKLVEIKDHPGLKTQSSQITQRFEQLSSKILENSGVTAAATSSASVSGVGSSQNYSEVVGLERRVSALETILGHASNILDTEGAIRFSSGGSAAVSTFPLVDTVARLERRVALLDPATLDALRSKASLLKTELEGVAKARSSGSGPAAGQSDAHVAAVEATKKVDELAEAVDRVKSIADETPALIVRLKTLDRVHTAATTFAQRLDSMEQSVSGLAQELQSNAQVLASLQQGLADNSKTILSNLQKLSQK